VIPCALVLVEGIQQTPFPTVPKAPAAFVTSEAPVLVLPANWKDDELVMLWSTTSFPTIANGSSGFNPIGLLHLREVTRSFPDAPSVDYLRGLGVRTVLVLRHPYAAQAPNPPDDAEPPPRAFTASVDGLGITREDRPDAVVFHLSPP